MQVLYQYHRPTTYIQGGYVARLPVCASALMIVCHNPVLSTFLSAFVGRLCVGTLYYSLIYSRIQYGIVTMGLRHRDATDLMRENSLQYP